VVLAAFSRPGHNAGEDVEIVRATWLLGAAPPELDLVALAGREIAGHTIGARGRLGEHEAIGLAPLSVAPQHQRQGIGSALVVELLRRAEAGSWPMVVLLGDPGYYGRFGFEPASRWGITYAGVGEADPHFQVRRLRRFDASWRGTFVYCWEQ
jgi:putative acetyltransferase